MPCSEQPRAGLVLAALLACAGPVVAQGERVNQPLRADPSDGGDVDRFLLTPDGTQVLYSGDLRDFGNGWHAVPSAGGTSRRLSGLFDLEIAPGGERYITSYVTPGPDFHIGVVESERVDGGAGSVTVLTTAPSSLSFSLTATISPDGRWVVAAANGVLWSAPIDGSQPQIGLFFSGVADAKVLFTPDSGRVVFRRGNDLLSVPVDGSASSVLLASARSDAITKVALTPDSQRVVYIADSLSSGRFELFAGAVDGSGASVPLNGTPVAGGDISAFKISPDGSWVAFRGDVTTDARFELFRAPIDGSSAAILLSGALVSGGNVEADFGIARDGEHVYFRADKEVDGRVELYSVPAGGGHAPLKLNASLPPGGKVTSFAVPAAGRRLVFRADQSNDEVYELFSVPSDGSLAPLALSGPLPSWADVSEDYQVGSAGTFVFFLLDRDNDGDVQLFLRRMDGGGALHELGGPLVAGGDVRSDFVVNSRDRRVFYIADATLDERFELFTTTLEGSPVRLNAELYPGRIQADVTGWFPDGNGRVVYVADRDVDEKLELHSAALDGPGDFAKLSPALPADRDVHRYLPTPDGRWTLFTTTTGASLLFPQLYAAPDDGSQPARRLNGGSASSVSVVHFLPSPDSRRALYVADQESSGRYELYSVPVDGSASALKLNAPVATGDGIEFRFEVTSTGHVVFQIGSDAAFGGKELWSAPIDGSAPALKLSTPLVGGGTIREMRVSSDGRYVVYLADQDTLGTLEIYSVPVDGSSASVRLNAPLVTGGNVNAEWFAISADSTRVVYIADQSVNELFELHSAPIDGSTSAIEIVSLSGALEVRDFRITPDSTRVVYRADQVLDEDIELFRVPIDGSALPTRLNAPLLGIDDVQDYYLVTPDSLRAVYMADQEPDPALELYSVRLDLASAPVKLSTPAGGAQGFPALSADGHWVAYSRTRPGMGSRPSELVLTPVDGGFAPRILTQLASGRIIWSFSFTPDSRRLLYLADQETAGVTELFQCIVGRPLRRR